jgi:hypothetical protein
VQAWLGHHSAAFTLERYAHLMDGGLGDADFLDTAVSVGNGWATHDPETAASGQTTEVAESAV